jgi:hypothetical protein
MITKPPIVNDGYTFINLVQHEASNLIVDKNKINENEKK